ncbi:hypothetical protein FO519_008271 [Halicephalobus sp. NKZ332]|nr:hypothetical protein FO519_008271 [Halicephalobus sp. NKZ332]
MSKEPYSPLHRPESIFERKIRRSPLSLFFPSFNRQSSEMSSSFDRTSISDRNPTCDRTTSALDRTSPDHSPLKKDRFRSTRSFDTVSEKKLQKKGYRTLLTPDDGREEFPSIELQHKLRKNGKKKPPKSVSFQDLAIYPSILTQAIRSISPGRSSKLSVSISPRKKHNFLRSISPGRSSKFSMYSEYSNYSLSTVPKETSGLKKSISSYILGCNALCVKMALRLPAIESAPGTPIVERKPQSGQNMNFLAVPDPYGLPSTSSSPSGSPKLSIRSLNNFRKKSISDLNLVFDIVRGADGPIANSQFVHPERIASGEPIQERGGRGRRNAVPLLNLHWKNITPNHISRQLLLVQEEKAMQAAPTAPIDATKFVAYVTERRKKRILFKGEYLMVLRSIDPIKCQCNVASSMADKNQYPDTLPYDHARVILSKKGNDENSHYINASYVSSWLREKAYVVTQSVKTKAACAEFWRMIWELRSNTIVMLTKVFDFMRVMCIQYWPITTFRFGEIEVETLETKTYAHFVIRTMKLKNMNDASGDERIVKHFHFTEWELNSFPYISAFIELRRRVRQWTDKNHVDAPVVVHCRWVLIYEATKPKKRISIYGLYKKALVIRIFTINSLV